jgi:hypothetical protein
MVLIEKALSLQRQGVDLDAYTGVDAAEDTWVTNTFNAEIKQAMARVTGFVDGLATNFRGFMGNVNSAVITTLGKPIKPMLSYQIAVVLDRDLVKEPKHGGFGLENTQLYDMEPFAGPEKHVDLGVELYDIESSWK